MRRNALIPVAAFVLSAAPPPALASYAFYVGRDLSATGATLVGGTGEEVSSHWLEIVPAEEHPEGATIEVGVTPDASIPGELTEIPQASRRHCQVVPLGRLG